jgi:UDP-N-acetylmuramoyl-tripeptide--D-alanyl-D-alanine ligase
MRFSARLAAAATGGELVGPDVVLDGASFDSRTLRPGQLFVPLVAERDGHEFIHAAVAAGAPAYLTARPVGEAAASAIAVEDTARALLDLGRWGRDRLAGLGGRVVGVTGSVGKTSVKDLATAALGARWRTASNPRSYNTSRSVASSTPTTPSRPASRWAWGTGEILRL